MELWLNEYRVSVWGDEKRFWRWMVVSQSGAATKGAQERLRKIKFILLTGTRSRKHCTTPGPQGKIVA